MIQCPPRVRIADARDEEEVMELCRELHLENGLFPLNEDKVRAMLRRGFNREGGILGALGPPGSIEGLIFMLVSSFWYSDKPHLEELFMYVRPKFRQTKDLAQDQRYSRVTELIKFAKWCSETADFPLVIGVISDERTEGKVRMYQRHFDKPVGNFFYYHKAPENAVASPAHH